MFNIKKINLPRQITSRRVAERRNANSSESDSKPEHSRYKSVSTLKRLKMQPTSSLNRSLPLLGGWPRLRVAVFVFSHGIVHVVVVYIILIDELLTHYTIIIVDVGIFLFVRVAS